AVRNLPLECAVVHVDGRHHAVRRFHDREAVETLREGSASTAARCCCRRCARLGAAPPPGCPAPARGRLEPRGTRLVGAVPAVFWIRFPARLSRRLLVLDADELELLAAKPT